MNKTRLVLFYSWSGNTRRAARLLAERAGADLVELEPVSPYPADYAQTVRQAGREIRQGVCPALRPLSLDLSGCEALFLGTPNWCGTMAPPLQSFLRQALPQGLRAFVAKVAAHSKHPALKPQGAGCFGQHQRAPKIDGEQPANVRV